MAIDSLSSVGICLPHLGAIESVLATSRIARLALECSSTRSPRALVAVAVLLIGSLFGSTAVAFCRTTTCDPSGGGPNPCQYDSDGCPTNGLLLYWPRGCAAFSVQQNASELRGISLETMQALTRVAYDAWAHVDCGGGLNPSLLVREQPAVECDQVQYNREPGQPNVNLWIFRDREWPHVNAATLALTTVTFDKSTGEIQDVDVELNSSSNEITVGDQRVRFDLASIVQHESGHALGLSHSSIREASMFAQYTAGEVMKRSLSADDMAGICAVYPPGEQPAECPPAPSFSATCRVLVAGAAGASGSSGSVPKSAAGAGGPAGSRGRAGDPEQAGHAQGGSSAWTDLPRAAAISGGANPEAAPGTAGTKDAQQPESSAAGLRQPVRTEPDPARGCRCLIASREQRSGWGWLLLVLLVGGFSRRRLRQ